VSLVRVPGQGSEPPAHPSDEKPHAVQGRPASYKVVEVSPVSEEGLEEALNRWTAQGWGFESLHFVAREGSHRPALAYLFFVQSKP
jgi:hypothetical protein